MKKGCLITFLAIIALGSLGLVYYFYQQNQKDPYTYQSVKPEINDIIKKAVASGSIKPRKEVSIKPQVSGVVENLFVEAGDVVTKGQKIAKIKLIPSQVNINSAQSNVELTKMRYEDSKRELERQRKLNSQNLDTEQAKANYENANAVFERQRSLHEQGMVSDQELDNFKLDAELKKSVYENSKINATNRLRQLEIEMDIRKQEMNGAKNNLQLLREGATSNSKQVSNVIVSTMNGMVLDVPVEEGSSVIERNTFNEGTSVASIADMGSLIFEGDVDESDVGKLKEGMALAIKVGAIDDEVFDGMLEFISPKGVNEDGTVKFKIKAAITQDKTSNSFLRAGYSANADIILDKREAVVSINERDMILEDGKYYVELVKGDQEFEKHEIETGMSDGILIEVVSGIDTSTQIKLRSDPGSGN